MGDIEYISTHLSRCEILAQLAEDAAELAQTALKLRRTLDDVNPTPVTLPEACDNLAAEYAEVSLCIGLLLALEYTKKSLDISIKNAARWQQRLEDRCHEEAERL